jgi:signal transduction histidine kinase
MEQFLDSVLVLVVDDNETNREVLRHRLEKAGFGVLTASDGHEALSILESPAGRTFDAVLLDYMMPDLNGMDVLKRIRETRSAIELPVIMQTARSDSKTVVDCIDAGANDYVTKPIDLGILLSRLQAHLKIRQLSRDKDSFLAIASHDLKTPLATISLAASVLKTMTPVGDVMTERSWEMLSKIERQAGVMAKIVGDFLELNALESGSLQLDLRTLPLVETVREVVEELQPVAASKHISLRLSEIEIGTEELFDGDASRIQQILTNLIGNALKFSPPGSPVEIKIRAGEKGYRIDVLDSGPGIPSADFERIFKKNNRSQNKPTGGEKSSGLGLCISQWLATLHGGQIVVRNNLPGEGPGGVGQGACFRLILPRSKANATQR